MSSMNYSLCAAYPLRSKPDKLMLFRLADYNIYSREYMPVLYTDWATETDPKIIGAKPIDVYRNLTEVRKWDYDDDDRSRTFSHRADVAFFEIVFPKELRGINYSETKYIREILLTGFSLEENVSSDLMIVIGETASRYAVIYCKKSKLKMYADGRYAFSDNITDVLHATHFLQEYDILKTDIIDTADTGIILPDGTAAPIRYFYRFSELPPSIGQFQLFTLDAYIPQFISRYLRKNKDLAGIGNADIRRVTDTIQTILSNREYISDYFSITGYTQEHLCEQLSKYSADIIADIFSDEELDNAIRTTLLRSEKIKMRCFSIARDQWLQEHDEERIAVVEELSKLSESRVNLEQQYKNLSDQVAAQQSLMEELEANISQKKAEEKKIQSDIEEELRHFSENIIHSITISSIAQTTIAQGVDKFDNKPSLVKTNSFEVIGADDEIESKADFEECLSENLETLGYSAEDAVDLSQLITFCICNKLPLVIKNDGESITNAVSAMFGLSQTGIINLPSGFIDLDHLHAQIEQAVNIHAVAAIYVTGVFEGYSLSVYNSLKHFIKSHTAPIFVAIALDGIAPEMLPCTIWESAMYLNDDNIFQYAESAPLAMYESIPDINTSYAVKEIKGKLKELKPFMRFINRRFCIQLAKLMVDFNVTVTENAIILQQLFLLASSQDDIEKLNEVLKNYTISDKSKRLILKYM